MPNWKDCLISSSYSRSTNLCLEAVVDCVGKPRIFIQCSCLIATLHGDESALWKTKMFLPNAGRKIANIQVRIARSLMASVHEFGAVGVTMALSIKQGGLYFYVYNTVNAAVTRDAIYWISGSGNPTFVSVSLADSTRSHDTPVLLWHAYTQRYFVHCWYLLWDY